jgi:hypothetical protein
MELDLQSLFGLHVHSCTHRLRPRNSPPPPQHLGSYTRVLLVSQDRRYLFVTPWKVGLGFLFMCDSVGAGVFCGRHCLIVHISTSWPPRSKIISIPTVVLHFQSSLKTMFQGRVRQKEINETNADSNLLRKTQKLSAWPCRWQREGRCGAGIYFSV